MNLQLGNLHDMAEDSVFSRRVPASLHFEASDYDQSIMQCPSSSHNITTMPQHLGLPPIAADVNGWAFQGVDLAFFDSLMRGSDFPDAEGLEQQWIEDSLGNV